MNEFMIAVTACIFVFAIKISKWSFKQLFFLFTSFFLLTLALQSIFAIPASYNPLEGLYNSINALEAKIINNKSKNKSNTKHMLMLADLYLYIGQLKKAESLYEEILYINNGVTDARTGLAWVWLENGVKKESIYDLLDGIQNPFADKIFEILESRKPQKDFQPNPQDL